MSLLSEYEKRTAWKYNPITGRFSTHSALTCKVDDAGRFAPFLGSTVVDDMGTVLVVISLRQQKK